MKQEEVFIKIDDIIVADKEYIKLGLEIIATIRTNIRNRRQKIKELERLKIKIDNEDYKKLTNNENES